MSNQPVSLEHPTLTLGQIQSKCIPSCIPHLLSNATLPRARMYVRMYAFIFEQKYRWTHAQQVDFTPANSVTPADEPAPFPPANFTPGAVGDKYYSPLVVIDNIGGSVWNAPIVASGVSTEYLNQFCDMDTIPKNMAEEAYTYVPR